MSSVLSAVCLAVIAFFAGLIGAAVGPGGVLLIAALYTLTNLTPTEIAGTSSALFIPGLALASAVYTRSGDLRVRLAIILGSASIIGTIVGVRFNQFLSDAMFGVLLSLLLAWAGLYIFYRELGNMTTEVEPDISLNDQHLAVVGFFVGICGGILGVGGPVLAVPALILLGVPIVPAVAAAQVQGLFITGSTSVNYISTGNVIFSLVGWLLGPLLLGVVLGWRLAQRASPQKLRYLLGLFLVSLSAVLLGDALSIV